MSSFVAGAEMMTFFTVGPRCAFAFTASVKKPVDSTTISAQNRVVFQQVRERCGRREVIDGDELDLGIAESCAENIAADAAEAVDAYFDCHECLLLTRLRRVPARVEAG